MTTARQRVLVVDDSPQNRLVATGHLETAGYEVIAVGSGEDALATLEKQRVDLVVLDVLMPGLGGFETCRRIRSTPATADIPVLFLTALGDREATAPAIEAGGDDLLPKPFHRAELLLRARALIRQRQTMAELKQALRALAEQNELLRRIEHDKRRLNEVIVHELRNPISAVLANAEVLQLIAKEGQAEPIEDIITAAGQLARVANDLLDRSRIDDSELAPKLESFSLPELASEVAATMRGMTRWMAIQIEIDVRAHRVVADRELTRRLLQNLVHNAVKHAPEGTAVRIEASVDADGLVLRVIDSGPGVPADDAEAIFERGVAADEAAAMDPHGLGLGFCRLAAEAHGGRIWVEPHDGHGASFCVRIPQPVS